MRIAQALAWIASTVSCSATLQSSSGIKPTADAGDTGSSQVVQIGVGPTGDHRFLPPSLTVPVGTTVQWFWYSSGHNVISGAGGIPDNAFCSPNDHACATAPTSTFGTTYEHTFTTPGTY